MCSCVSSWLNFWLQTHGPSAFGWNVNVFSQLKKNNMNHIFLFATNEMHFYKGNYFSLFQDNVNLIKFFVVKIHFRLPFFVALMKSRDVFPSLPNQFYV